MTSDEPKGEKLTDNVNIYNIPVILRHAHFIFKIFHQGTNSLGGLFQITPYKERTSKCSGEISLTEYIE